VKATFGFVSFTEVEPGEHRSYNEWHLFDHLPEQLPLAGIVWGQRWVLTPALRERGVAQPPLDRIHYVTLYLLAEPIEQTLAEFRALAQTLRELGRFHEHRRSHLFGPLAVESWRSTDPAVISAEAVPFRPCTGVHVRLERADERSGWSAADLPGVVGTWTFTGHPELSPPELRPLRATWSWLDGDPAVTAAAAAPLAADPAFEATLATVDPAGPWDWFD
jgi:hypothetical protein